MCYLVYIRRFVQLVVVGGGGGVGGRLDVGGRSGGRAVVHHGAEAAVVVGGVLHGPHGAVRLQERVRALHDVAVADLLLLLVVAVVPVRHRLAVLVLRVCLGKSKNNFIL